MGISNVYGGLIKTVKAADLDVLTNGEHLLLQRFLHGQIAHLAGLKRLNVRRSFLHDNAGQIGNKLLEVRILCNKVGLRVDLDDRAYAALIAYGRADNTLSRNTVRLLGSLGETLLTQQFDRLVEVAVRLCQRLLAVHHAYVGHFTELLYVSSSKSHFLFLQNSFLQNKNRRA